jgi:GntP family gluconate:H+ symporter
MGFGEIMAEVGLLIGFGVLIGAFLHSAGAFHRLLDVFVRVIGATRLPYALSLLHSTILPSIYVDVQVVLASPVARSAAPYISRNGLPIMASALGAGIFAGYVFVIPGLAAISIAGLLGVPLGRWLLFGIVIGPSRRLSPASSCAYSWEAVFGDRSRTKTSTRRWPSKRPTSWRS